MPCTLRQLLDEIAGRFSEAGIGQPRREATRLATGLLDIPLAFIYAHTDESVDERQASILRDGAERRARHVPMSYILGTSEFAGLSFQVGPGVLTPRADSECLVEAGLAAISRLNDGQPAAPVKILDLCTGTGCIGISLAIHLKAGGRTAELWLTEKDPGAAEFARRNLDMHQLDDARLVITDLFPPEPDLRWLLVVANPPYIPSGDISTLMPEVRCHEPHLALDGGADGLDICRRIVQAAPDHLMPGGWLLLEHGFDQAEAVRGLLEETGQFDLLPAVKDYGGNPRVSGGRLCSV